MTETAGSLRRSFRVWLEQQDEVLAPFRAGERHDFESSIEAALALQGLLGASGWIRHGWPESAGGLGGSMQTRIMVYDELAAAGLPVPVTLEIFEIIAPMLVRYAPAIAAVELPLVFAGRRSWCQGFSEPGAGSDLARISTRAVAGDGHFVINGQKIWTSHAHVSQRCGLLARTGASDSAHRGLTMFWVDLSLPGVTVRPIRAASGHNEFCEVFFDDVVVDEQCLVGGVGQGWEVAMYLLQFERAMYAWMRQASLHRKLTSGMHHTAADRSAELAADLGAAYVALSALRARCGRTVDQLSDGAVIGATASVDKLMLGSCEQNVTDWVRRATGPAFLADETPEAAGWQFDWFWARASTIFGGAAEIQREIVADRLLDLPREARGGR